VGEVGRQKGWVGVDSPAMLPGYKWPARGSMAGQPSPSCPPPPPPPPPPPGASPGRRHAEGHTVKRCETCGCGKWEGACKCNGQVGCVVGNNHDEGEECTRKRTRIGTSLTGWLHRSVKVMSTRVKAVVREKAPLLQQVHVRTCACVAGVKRVQVERSGR